VSYTRSPEQGFGLLILEILMFFGISDYGAFIAAIVLFLVFLARAIWP